MKKILFVIALLFALYQQDLQLFAKQSSEIAYSVNSSDSVIVNAFSNKRSDIQVSGTGTVIKLLSDDNDGSRHQRILIKLASGHTLLIAHNIDLASRVSSVSQGDSIEFYGEYEWNKKGGVIHWTHSDPRGKHTAGWLKHNGKKYQ